MAHQHHFLSRLDRLSVEQVDLALALYRDEALVRFILASVPLPERAERVAISLNHPHEGPFLVVTREGVFVTCLAAGMAVSDLPVVRRVQLDGAMVKAADFRERSRQFDVTAQKWGGPDGLLYRLQTAGAFLSREEIVALSVLQPILFQEMFTALAVVTEELNQLRDMLLPMVRKANKLGRASDPLLRHYWTSVWAVSHLTVLTALEGPTFFDRIPEPIRESLRDASFSWPSVRQGLIATVLRGLWGAARLGKSVVAGTKIAARKAQTILGVVDSVVGLAAVGLRHARVRTEVEEFLDSLSKADSGLSDGKELAPAIAGLMCATMRLDSEKPEELRKVAINVGRKVALETAANLVKGSTFAYEQPEDVPDSLATSLAFSLPMDVAAGGLAFELMAAMVPSAARARLEDLYLPRDFLRAVNARWAPEDSYRLLRPLATLYKPPPPDRSGPSRNGPCPCGSKKKYKRCCGADQST
ncbi:MAG: SEC-C domain-containing protein [Polyangiaceae bacterium]|nr:SEC-C domain-containing protein [Polyangiaceae bacterium]